MIFETHAHYDDEAFDSDRETLIGKLPEQGISPVVNVGASLDSCKRTLELVERYPFFYGAIGVHPSETRELTEENFPLLREWCRQERIVAVGEIGLDYYWAENPPKERQQELFRQQVLLAKELGLPVIIHDREAHADILEVLRELRPQGVLHCFSGSAEMAREAAALGMYMGFTGAVTFKNARKAPQAAAAVPDDRLLIETDCPYMAPEPYRGKRCDSSMLPRVAERLAEIRGCTAEEIVEMTCRNAKRLFGIA